MLRIVEDLMSLSRIEADRFVAPEELVDMREVASAVIANAAPIRGAPGNARSSSRRRRSCPRCAATMASCCNCSTICVSNALRYGCDKPGACVELELRHSGSGSRFQ